MENEIINYVEYLFALALKMCGDVNNAEDLTQETLLTAFQYINRGGNISNMKYWLTSVLSNKWNEALRQKYRLPLVSVDVIPDVEDYNDENDIDRHTNEQVRREVAYLAKLQREVIVKHYLEGKKVQDIADELGIPKGTVLSRLSSGRDQMRKGFDSMEQYEKHSYVPERLEVGCSGNPGFNEEPWSLVSDDLMKQNILIIAYEQPVTAVEIAKALGIPTPYVENAIDDLVKCELMVRSGNRVVTDFLISTPAERSSKLDIQLDFADQQARRPGAGGPEFPPVVPGQPELPVGLPPGKRLRRGVVVRRPRGTLHPASRGPSRGDDATVVATARPAAAL